MAWRLAKSLEVLRAEANARGPRRSKVSDGTIGDAAHASRGSDHNPWVKDPATGIGVVRAFDCTDDPPDHSGDSFAEHIRRLGRDGFPALRDGGYVIDQGWIAGGSKGWAKRPYTGPNAHNQHTHTSVGRSRAAFDYAGTWHWHPAGVVVPPSVPPPPPIPKEVVMVIVFARADTPEAIGAATEAFRNGLAGAVLTHDPAIARAAMTVDQHRVVAIGGPSSRELYGDRGTAIGVYPVGRHLAVVGSDRHETARIAIDVAKKGWAA